MARITQIAENGKFIAVFNGEINQTPEMLCNARDLHKFLNVGRDFSNWIKNRIKQYGFVKNQDFILVRQNGRTNGKGGDRRSVDYHLTLDMAKELAMIENNEQGRKVRRYFIQMEKQQLTQNYSLIDQYNKAVLEFEKFSDMASNAGRMLNLTGKQFKPKAKEKVLELTIRLQPYLPFVEFGGAK